jgi:hypothetical protein
MTRAIFFVTVLGEAMAFLTIMAAPLLLYETWPQ